MRKTSIIILSYNTLAMLQNCIHSIRRYTKPGSYEIIVVDNASHDGSADWLKTQKDIRCIFNKENAGFPKGCNQGMAIADPQNDILLLNSDTIVTPRWLDNMQTALYAEEKTGIVGCVTNYCSNNQSIVPSMEYHDIDGLERFADSYNKSNPDLWEKRTTLVGFCYLIKRETVDKVGILDEQFTPGNYEDDDYSLRALVAGYELLLCKDTYIHHIGSGSFVSDGDEAKQQEKLAKFNKLLERNKKLFAQKWQLNEYYLKKYKGMDPNLLRDYLSDPEKYESMKKILFIVRKTSEQAHKDFINSLNALKKPLCSSVQVFIHDEDHGGDSVSNAYLNVCREENPDISILMDDTVLLVNENCLQEIVDIFEADSSIGVIGVKGAGHLPINGNIEEAEDLYGGFYEMNPKREVFEKKYQTVSSDYVQVEAVSSLFLAVRGYIPIWSGVNYRCVGETVSAAAAIYGYKAVVPKNAASWCFSTIPELKPTAEDMKFVKERYEFKRILLSKKHCLLTIGIPTFNRVKYFSKCIRNLYKQIGNMPWIKVFVSNNNSTDNTEEIALQYSHYKNFRYYKQPVNIRGKNFYYLYENADGDFVVACGDDDYYTGEAILNMLEAICLHPDSSVITLNWTEMMLKNLSDRIICYDRGMNNFLPQCTTNYTALSCIVLNHRQYMAVTVKDKFSHTHLNQCYVQLEMLRNAPAYSVVYGGMFLPESGEAAMNRTFTAKERTPFCSIFIREYYPILDYFLGKGLSKEAYEKEKIINLNKVLSWLRSINKTGNAIQWCIDEDLEALMEEFYGYEPYYEDLKQEIKHILENAQ